MKTKTLKLLLFFCFISLIDIKAQPYIYFSIQLQDTTYGKLEKIVRFNLTTNSVEDFLPQQPIGKYAFPVWDPSQIYLNIEVHKWSYFIYNCFDTSINFDLHDLWGLHFDEMLYSSERNKLYIFSDDYAKISVFDILSGTIISELNLGKTAYSNDLMNPARSSFFSSDYDKIYFYNVDTNNVSQVWTYSLETNQITQKRNLFDLGGHVDALGYSLTFGRNGRGIITSYPVYYGNPDQDFYYKFYDFDTDTSSPFIYHDGESEAYFNGDGEFILIMETQSDTLTLEYYHTGEAKIYKTSTGQLHKILTLPSKGIVYTFDNYPNNIYYVIDIEEPTRQIYTIKMDSIFNVIDLTLLNPSSAIVNSPPFTLTVNGYGFDSLSIVFFNDTAKTTTYISDSVLTADISTSDISVVGNYPVWVTDQWGTSDTLFFEVTPIPPVLTSISPGIVLRYVSGGLPPNGLTVTAAGANFTDSSVAYFNGNAKATTVVSDTVLTFPITGTEMSTLGNYPVWISTYGINSDTLTLQVVDNLITMQQFIPTLQCVQNNGGGSYTAYFGYVNDNGVSIYVPIGSKNKFSPFPIDRGQPKLFEPGTHTNVFSVNFNGRDLIWTLDQTSVTANRNSPPCP